MERDQKQIEAAVRRVRKRLSLLFLVKWLLIGFAAGMLTGCAVLLITRSLIVPHYRWWAVGIAAMVTLLFIVCAWLKRPTWREAVRTIDEPTENRVGTALKYAADDTAIAKLQRKETVRAVTSFIGQLRQYLPFSISRKWMTASISLFAAFVLLWFIPNEADEVLAKRQLEEEWIEQQEQKIDELLEEQKQREINTTERLPEVEEVSPDVEAELEKLLEELKETVTMPEALQKLEQTLRSFDESLKALEKEWQKAAQEQSNQDGDAQGSGTDEDKNTNVDERKRQLEELQQQAEEIAQALAQMGLSAARELENDGIPVSGTWREGGLASELSNLPSSGTDPSELEGGSNESDGEGPNSENLPGEGSSSEQGGSSGDGEGSNGQGGTEGSEGEGSGTGSGTGSGSGQSGAGGGSNGQGGSSGGLQGGFGSGGRNEVSTPRKFEGEGDAEIDGGPVNGEGGETEHGGRAPAESGSATPYEEVYGIYEQEARQSMDRRPIPDRLKSIVKDYFTNIQPASP